MATAVSPPSVHVIIPSGPGEPKRLMLGLAMAAAAAAAGTVVRVFLIMDGVMCLTPEFCSTELLRGYPPPADLLAAIHEAGGSVEYCPNCLPSGCDAALARATAPAGNACRCAGVPAGLASYGVRLADIPTVVF
ncbi:MAG: DsrE family protein [Bryobacteraceae bacterium]